MVVSVIRDVEESVMATITLSAPSFRGARGSGVRHRQTIGTDPVVVDHLPPLRHSHGLEKFTKPHGVVFPAESAEFVVVGGCSKSSTK